MLARASEVARLLQESAEPVHVHQAAVGLLRMLYLHPTEAVADWHPLGFLHIKAFQAPPTQLRIHVWGTAADITFDQAVCPIHDHVWELISQVLVGSLVNVEVQSEPASLDRATHRAASVNYHGAINHVVAHGHGCRLTESRRTTWAAGERYSVPTGELHRTVIPEGNIVATVVLATTTSNQAPRTYLPINVEQVQMTRVPATISQITNSLESVLNLLDSDSTRQ